LTTRKATFLKKIYKHITVLVLLLFILPVLPGCAEKSLERYEDTRELMDTFVQVVVYAEEPVGQEAVDAAFTRMEEVEQVATTWDSSGEAYRLNQTGYLENASDDLLALLGLSIEYCELTGGVFDITVQPLLDLWEFNPEAEKQFWELDEATQLSAINEAMALVGCYGITIEGSSVRLEDGMEITLGGIAKGYAADEALETLAGMGIEHALINAGGDIRTLGAKPGNEPWAIGMVNPDDTTESLATFDVVGKSVTTSGNYERYFNPDKTIHHIMDPRTGYSAGDCISVSIITTNGAMADALATAVFVLGPEQGMDLVESLDDVETLIIDKDRNIYRSSGLSAYLVEE
jgi:thiamine biosynthesis lipoprotein